MTSAHVPKAEATVERRCPCGSGEILAACCARYLGLTGDDDAASGAPTAEALMRSRYSAFALGDADYLLRTWHPSTRPSELELDDELRWLHLSIDDVVPGGPFDERGIVEFTAVYRGPGGRGRQHERSRFVREGGRWYYVDGDVD